MILLFAILSLTGHVSTCIACFIIHYPWWWVISMYTKCSLSPWIINPISISYFVHTCFLPNVINTEQSKTYRTVQHFIVKRLFLVAICGWNFFPLQWLQLMNSKSLQSDVIDYWENASYITALHMFRLYSCYLCLHSMGYITLM